MFQTKKEERTSRAPGSAAEARTTSIGQGVSFAGGISGRGDVEVFGTLEGPLTVDGRVRVGEGGRCLGDIEARDIVVEGEIRGDIRALERAELSPTARVFGKVQAPRLSIGEGARLEGTVVMSEGHLPADALPPEASTAGQAERRAVVPV